jgi:transglutaminase-like putative cysteine protease
MLSLRTQPAPVISRSRSILGDSVLSSSLHAEDLRHLAVLGEVVDVPSGATVFEAGAPADYLHVVLDGALLPVMPSGAPPSFWVGPGDACGEVGFALGTPRRTTMIAFGPAPRLWRIHREVLSHAAGATGVAATRLLAAISRVVSARLERPARATATWTETDYADHRHPAVVALARRLARPTPRETVCSVWAALWKMPYRFGSWQWTASETLARGHGMCTTKAVLQVALMRALDIECGYVRGELDGPLVRACMPRVYAPRFQRPAFKHYYAAARIEGRWVPLDASFSVGSLSLIAETEHHVKPVVSWDAHVEGFAHAGAALRGTDPHAIEVCSDIHDVMRKTATYDAKNADAMNVLLDRAQGYVAPVTSYVAAMERALAGGSFAAARGLVLDGLEADVAMLRSCSAAAKAA